MKERAAAVLREMRLENLVPAERHGERKRSAGQPLRVAGDIGQHIGLLAGKQCPGAAPARHDLIGDKPDAGCFTDTLHLLQHPRRVHQHPAGAKDQWLDDERGRLVTTGSLQRIQRLLLLSFERKRHGRQRRTAAAHKRR